MLNPVATCSLCSGSISLDTYKAFAQVLERSEEQRIEGEHKINCDKQAVSNMVYPQAQIRRIPSSQVSTSLVPIQKIAMGSAGKQQKCSWQ